MTVLILTEKPSAAKNFALALGGSEGIYNNEKYIIVPLRGHVIEYVDPHLQVPNHKQESYKTWSLDTMPWDEQDFNWTRRVKPGCSEVIKNLSSKLDWVAEIAIATDVDPTGEGEMIAWEVLDHIGWTGCVSRIYFADESKTQITKGFINRTRLTDAQSDGDYLKAETRTKFDMLSMQLTRLATLIAKDKGINKTLKQGRLKSPIVRLVGEQQYAHSSFVPTNFYELRYKDTEGNVFALPGTELRFSNAQEAQALVKQLGKVDVSVKDKKDVHITPAALLDLAALSAILATEGYSPKSVLETYQKLYEAQIVSYPRTEDKKITLEQFNELLPLKDKIARLLGIETTLLTHTDPRTTHVVQDGLAHGANRPGMHVPSSLSELDSYGTSARRIYELVARSFLSMLASDCIIERTQASLAGEFKDFVCKLDVVKTLGFKAVFDADKVCRDTEDKDEQKQEQKPRSFGTYALPFVHKGKTTRPQKPTLKWLVKKLEAHDVGTGATRTSTISEMCSKHTDLLRERKGVLSLGDNGKDSYVLLKDTRIADVATTEELYKDMKAVGTGKIAQANVLVKMKEIYLHDYSVMLANAQANFKGATQNFVKGTSCPYCSSPLIRKDKTIVCSKHKMTKLDNRWVLAPQSCPFKLWAHFRSHELSDDELARIIAGQTLRLTLTSKDNKTYEGVISLDVNANTDNEIPNYLFEFVPNTKK